jgi:hypothetical protein
MSEPDARFDRFLERLARELSCARVEPAAGGDLRLRFEGTGRPCALVLLQRGGAPRGLCAEEIAESALVLCCRNPGARERALLHSAAAKLRALMADPDARRWIDRRNRNVTQVPLSPDGLLGLFGGILLRGRPFWHDWRVESAALKPPAVLTLRLKDGAGTALELALDTRDPSGSPLGTFSVSRDWRTLAQKDLAAGRPESALAYLLSKGTHDDMRWKAPPRAKARKRSAPTQLRRSLVENCLRSGAPWRGYSSRFFGVWGDLDHFGLTAAVGNYERVSYVAHASRECVYSSTVLDGRLKYHSSPWGAVSFLRPGEYSRYHLTDISDAALVSGGEGVLSAAIRQVARAAPERKIVVTGNCDYHVIGDDIDDVCRRCSARPGAVVHLNPPLPGFREVDSSNWWVDFFDTISFAPKDRLPDTLNLAGLGSWDEACVRELSGLLERCGIKVQAVILPNISPGAAAAFGRAALTVLSPWLPVTQVLEKALRTRGMRCIKPHAPYGVAGTRRWLAAVAAALGRRPMSEAAFARSVAELAPDFDLLRRRSRGRAAGFICDVGNPEELCSPSVFFGMDLPAFFTELGFSPVIFAPGRARSVRGARVAAFDESVPLGDLLRRQRVGLVYCDVCRGATVKRAGATPFAVEALSAGLAGAQKSLGRLLALAGLETYNRYGDLL